MRRSATSLAAALLATALVPAAPTAALATGRAAPPAPPSDRALAAQPARQDLTREQFYLLLPDRFADGDPANDRGGLIGDRLATGYDPTDKKFFQGGDLKGLTQRLDYIKGLGTTALWMAPVFTNIPVQTRDGGKESSAGYHGYWITDFTRVDPHFGTNDDLRKLIEAAHAKGMKVFFDVITNHTADTVDYAEKEYGYRPKGAYPYLDKDGRPFDDAVVTPGVDADSFPYTPVATGTAKVPAWLNDPAMYHNRGDSTFVGESGLYGDFFGHDDLWTERPEVVEGMKRIYETWVRDFGVDGFRVDTAKNVNMEFWTQWATALDAYAKKQGREDFFMFAEAFSADASITAPYVTEGRLDATLDFPLQSAIRNYASRGGPAGDLSHVLGQDYRYTTDKANAYEQVTFLGSHDMGRIGSFLKQDNPGASDAELVRRATLANELMFLSRGNPVVYSGDEQGFTGAGGDSDARQTLFASKVPDYLDDDQLGTDRTHATDAYDTAHPLYEAIARLSKLTREHPALRDGVQQERYAEGSVYAASRTDARQRVEYLVAANSSTEPKTVSVPVDSASFRSLYGGQGVVTAKDGKATVTVPALSTLVLRARTPLPRTAAAPSVRLTAPPAGATGTVEIGAAVSGDPLNRVVFAAQVGDGPWQTLGSADHAPYKVTHRIPAGVPEGTPVRYKAVVVDPRRRTASALAATTTGATPPPARPKAERKHVVVHHRRADGDYDGLLLRSGGVTAEFAGRDAYGAFAWIAPPEDGAPLSFTVEKDGVPDGPARALDATAAGEVWTREGSALVDATRPADAQAPQDPTKAVIHYRRPAGDYEGWGLHAWTGAAHPPEWNEPVRPVRQDAFGLVFEVDLSPGAGSLSYILHKKEEKDVPGDEALVFPLHGKEVWRLAGDPAYLSPSLGGAFPLDLGRQDAVWLDATTVVWRGTGTGVASQQLVYGPGGITLADGALSDEGRWLRLLPSALTAEQRAAHPAYADWRAFTIDPRDLDRAAEARGGQLIATQRAADGALLGATGVQQPPH
ncbi:hypothetical protein CP979_28950 [Streptomyces filamentosus]|nr:hypothetical protein CP979_28950 [Streptomyces filamentosus]